MRYNATAMTAQMVIKMQKILKIVNVKRNHVQGPFIVFTLWRGTIKDSINIIGEQYLL